MTGVQTCALPIWMPSFEPVLDELSPLADAPSDDLRGISGQIAALVIVSIAALPDGVMISANTRHLRH